MTIEMFLKMDGVTGGSRNYYHKGWADVLAWNWGLDHVENDGDGNSCTGMNSISLTKTIGVESPELMRLFAECSPIKSAELDFIPQVGKRDAQLKYVTIKLEDVRIDSIRIGGNGEQAVFTEDLALTFGKINYQYFEYAAAGTDGKAPAPVGYAFGWDLAHNASCEFAES